MIVISKKYSEILKYVILKPIVYMYHRNSAHILLNLLNELRKSDKMRGLPSILSLIRKVFNKFNNTGA